ncbi:hypothetical protein J4407_01135 [Candidatus Pacearchaeota archaeon]|nr:hypothetical protein [Candidatus Pacearchaeota archaeon]
MKSRKADKIVQGFSDNFEYFDENYENLRIEYPDEWVAIYNRKIIGHGKNLINLLEGLSKKEIDTRKVITRRTYFNEKRPTLTHYAA